MKAWVEQEARSADTYRRLEQTAILYSQKRASLLQGLELFPVLAWQKREKPSAAWAARYGQDFDRVMRFLARSRRRHAIKSIGKFLGFTAICFIALGMTWLWYQTDIERHKAASSRLLAESVLRRSKSPLNRLSILLGIEAMKYYPIAHFTLNQFQFGSLSMLPKSSLKLQHDNKVKKIVYSSDGKVLASVSKDNTVRLWDVTSGKELHHMTHESSVSTVIFSPDGKQIAARSLEKTVWLWDVVTGKKLQRIDHDGSVNSVTFSPDSRQLATASNDKTARLWNTSTGKELNRLSHDREVDYIIFSPDGKQVATTTSFDRFVRLWDAITGKELQILNHDDTVHAVVTFSPDGKQLATGCSDGITRLWDTATGKELQRLKASSETISFSPNGKLLAITYHGLSVELWNIETGKMQSLSHDSLISAVAFSPDGKQLSTVTNTPENTFTSTEESQLIYLWDTATGENLGRLRLDIPVNGITFNPSGKQLAIIRNDNTVQLWDVAISLSLKRLQHAGYVTAVTFSPDGRQLATASEDSTARLWDTATGQEMQHLNHDGKVNTVTYSPNGKQLATSSVDKTARLWDTSTGQELQRLSHDNSVNTVTFNRNGKLLATASTDNTSRLWDVLTGQEIQRLLHDAPVNYVTFSPDGKQFATASDDKTVQIWSTGLGIQRLHHESPVKTVSFSPDGKQIATASSDNTVRLWNTLTAQELHHLNQTDPFWAHTNEAYNFNPSDHDIQLALHGPVYIVTFSPDGRLLATSNDGSIVQLWDTVTGQEVRNLEHRGIVKAVSFSHDGEQIVTTGANNIARLWDTATGREIQNMQHYDTITAVAFSPDNRKIATASWDNTVQLWFWQPEDLINQLCSRVQHNINWDSWKAFFEDEPYHKTCDNLPIDSGLENKGKLLVREGKITEAITMIGLINNADPELKLDQKQTILKWEAPVRLEEAEQLLKSKKITEAISEFNQIDQMDNQLISAKSWNKLCWDAAVNGHAAQVVLNACEKAVRTATAVDNIWELQDSRGLARALTGNSQGAIEDFEVFILKTNDEKLKKQRQAWVQALQAGQNPFTKEELATLQDQ
ncbi:hypothetical protein CRENPOLYSF2_3060001 [Crenothrix polyspora]|uniref:Anaphase-promoting complex subunit 4-like WD40 domain-containing protein n=1 Tax=Crenothrix polyspora TaxID=360316 RepID=A0A1R4H9Y3_9GAMM|nr:WD40 repeat domain-containing protein [Crenothrix polyspora]SJM93055.1 hypothetical protein CRENPOLYSF2_3060001 [Crenothrix polyspora]